MLCSLLRLSSRKMGARLELDLILRRNGFQVIINDDFLEEGINDDFLEEGESYG